MAPPNDTTTAAPALWIELAGAARGTPLEIPSRSPAGVNVELTPANCDVVIHQCDTLRLFMQNIKRSMGLT